ncbi:hypothetical protein XENOCAPTIV_028010 [Xenoophorus captivus]|uniref:Ras-associating domain-containing protein n=1 Tax=Xenoophorus captivus TaxID=1517983 RepID=A0ABV0Q3Z2_9TELE
METPLFGPFSFIINLIHLYIFPSETERLKSLSSFLFNFSNAQWVLFFTGRTETSPSAGEDRTLISFMRVFNLLFLFSFQQSETKEEEEGGAKDLSEEEVRAKIESYNAQVSENGMNLAEDGSFTGFIKVHLRLSRPVTVEGNQGRAPLDDQDGKKAEHTEKRTSFYLPCDCVKQIHIGSLTTTSEVIQGLLKKFLVLDDPRKFALYRQTHRDGQGKEKTSDVSLCMFSRTNA